MKRWLPVIIVGPILAGAALAFVLILKNNAANRVTRDEAVAVRPEASQEYSQVDAMPSEFIGRRGLETWSQWAVSFEVGLYINGKPSSSKTLDAKHENIFLKSSGGKNQEILVSHRITSRDSAGSAWRRVWRWSLLRTIGHGKLQVYVKYAGKEDRPATPTDIPDIIAKEPKVIELR
jgi:hypothetical protein